MKLIDAKFDDYNLNGVEIYIDYYKHYKWWKYYTEYPCLYVSDKNNDADIYHSCAYLTYNGDEIGYVAGRVNRLFNDNYGFNNFDSYLEVNEFCFIDNDQEKCKLLLNYFISFAKYLGCKFIKISLKEDFSGFYNFIKNNFNYVEVDNCYIIKIENPILYDDYIYLKPQETDAITPTDLLFLTSNKFAITNNECYLKIDNEKFSINRNTAKITLPSFITNAENTPMYFNNNYYSIAGYLSRNFNVVKTNGLIINTKVKNVPYQLAFLGKKEIIIFHDISRESNYFDILYNIKKYTACEIFRCEVNYMPNFDIYHRGMYFERNLNKVINNLRFCLDIDGHTEYPPNSYVEKNNNFNFKLAKLNAFSVKISGDNQPISELLLDYENNIYTAKLNNYNIINLSFVKKSSLISVLENAYFANWKQEYFDANGEEISFSVTINLDGETFTFKGENKTPNVWKYFIEDLLNLITA